MISHGRRTIPGLCLAAFLLLMVALPNTAHATFPGENGELAVLSYSDDLDPLTFVDPVEDEITRSYEDVDGFSSNALAFDFTGMQLLANFMDGECEFGDSVEYSESLAAIPADDPMQVWDQNLCQNQSNYRRSMMHSVPTIAATADGRVVWSRYQPFGQNQVFHELVVSKPDGSSASTVGLDGGSVYGLLADPIDEDIAYGHYASGRNAGNGIASINLSGGARTFIKPRLNSDNTNFTLLDISPDGKWLLYRYVASGVAGSAIRAINVDTQAEKVLIPADGFASSVGQVVFSPDMEQIAYTYDVQGSAPPVIIVADISIDASGPTITDSTRLMSVDKVIGLAWRTSAPVDFTATEQPVGSGQYGFRSLAEDPGGSVVQSFGTPVWVYGDGTNSDMIGTGMAMNVNHAYTKPGTYKVTHTVRKTSTMRTFSGSKTIEVKAPELSVGISWPEELDQGGRLPLDTDIPIEVTVATSSTGVGDVRDIVFDATKLLTATVGGNLITLTYPEGQSLTKFTLAPNKSKKFTATLRANTRGELTLKSKVSGLDAAVPAKPVTAERIRSVKLGYDLKVDIVATPERIELDEVDQQTDRPKRKPLTIAVTVENVSDAEIKNAKFNLATVIRKLENRNPTAPEPLQMLNYKIDGGAKVVIPPFDLEPDENGNLDPTDPNFNPAQLRNRDLDTSLVKGEKHVITIEAEAVDKAIVELQAIARGVVQSDPVREASSSDTTDVYIGQPRLLVVHRDPDAGAQYAFKVGKPFHFSSVVENISPDQDVLVRVLTKRAGNVIGQPVGIMGLAPEAQNPFGVIKRIEPGERLPIWGDYTSDPTGSTSAYIDIAVDGWVVEDGKQRNVMPNEVIIEDQPHHGLATQRRMSIDLRDGGLPDWTYAELGWIFTDSAARGFGRWVDGTWELTKTGGRAFVDLALLPMYTVNTIYQHTKPEVRAATAAQISGYYAAIKNIDLEKAAVDVSVATDNAIGKVITTWNAGGPDARTIAAASGGFLGEQIPDLVIEAALPAVYTAKVVRTAGKTTLEAAEAAQEATKAARIAQKGRKGFKAADSLTFEHAMKYWGMDFDMDAALLKYAKAKKLVIAMRDRSPGSIQRLAEGALPKIEMIKSKNVSQLDIDFLGFHQDHLDFAMYKQMPNWSDVRAKVLAHPDYSPDLLNQVEARWAQRGEEYWVERRKMKKYEKAGQIPVPKREYGLNATDNGIPGRDHEIWDKREFRNVKAGEHGVPKAADGLDAFQPQVMGNSATGLDFHPMSGDMDLIAITDQNGNILPVEMRKEVYRELAAMGFQHPESMTWDNAKGRTKYLRDYDKGTGGAGDSLLGYMPDGSRRAVQFDSGKSVWGVDAASTFKGFLFLEGMDVVMNGVGATAGALFDMPDPTKPADADLDPVGTDPMIGLEGDGSPNANLSANPGTPLIRRNLNGTYSKWNPTTEAWEDYVPAAGEEITSVPQTMVSEPAAAGATRIVIAEDDRSGFDGGPNAWFQPGMQVVLDPGGANQEFATMSAHGSIIVSAPLTKDHAFGEMIAMLPIAAGSKPSVTMAAAPSGIVRGTVTFTGTSGSTGSPVASVGVQRGANGGAMTPLCPAAAVSGQVGSWTCTWNSATAPDGRHVVRATSKTASNATSFEARRALVVDNTAPVVPTPVAAIGVAATQVVVTFDEATDAMSGLASHALERRTAPLAGGACGAPGGWVALGVAASPFTDSLALDTCVEYRRVATDRAGNTAASGTSTRVVLASPAVVVAPRPVVVAPPAAAPAKVKPNVGVLRPVISGKAVLYGKLSCRAGNWTGTAPIKTSFVWQRYAKVKKRFVWTPIKRATKSTYVVTARDLGTKLRCVVTAKSVIAGTSVAGKTSFTTAAKAIPKARK